MSHVTVVTRDIGETMPLMLPTIVMGQLEDRIWKCIHTSHNFRVLYLKQCAACSSLFSIIEAYDLYYFENADEI